MTEVSSNKDRSNKQNVAICMDSWRKRHSSAAEAREDSPLTGKTSLVCFARVQIGKIDVAKGIIHGVSVISEGEVQGHEMYADAKTLQTVMASAKTYEGGLKVKLDHGSSVGSIVGYLDNFRIDGPQLRADLNLLENSEHTGYVLELAVAVPEQVGMSIAFSFDAEDVEGLPYPAVRCLEIYSCDLVDSPAANAGGLFSTTTKMSEDIKNPETPAASKEEAPTIESRMSAIEATLASLTSRLAELSVVSSQLSAIETVANGFVKSLEEQKEAFETKLTTQATEFTSQLKDANVLASRKLAATGVPAGKAPAAENGEKIIDFQSTLMAMKDPMEQLAFYHRHKEKIHSQFERK